MTNWKRPRTWVATAAIVAAVSLAGYALAQGLTPKEELGQGLYFSEYMSTPDKMACAGCHDPDTGFVDPDANLPVSEGVIPGRFGARNAPAAAYAMYAPVRYYDEAEGTWLGGQFWDGRATGELLGDPLADQAAGPPLNPVEMNSPNKKVVIIDVARAGFAELFEEVWGAGSLSDVPAAYDQVALSIAAFERTQLFGQFSSCYDAYLAACLGAGGDMDDCANGNADQVVLTDEEWAGLQLFVGANDNNGVLEPGEGAGCAGCHVMEWTTTTDYSLPVQVPDWAPEGQVPPLFTDFTYDNLGVPKNWDNPFLYLPRKFNPDGVSFVDYGLGGNLQAGGQPPEVYEPELGKFKVMTVRNIGLTAPYGHNGYFDTLADIVHFYNTRDDGTWPEAEVGATVNMDELGNLGLSSADEANLVAFMLALSDGCTTP
jgi:cytochrome c peroxidase